ncbi:hypothetical protein D3C81_1867500 [compost metagenome]
MLGFRELQLAIGVVLVTSHAIIRPQQHLPDLAPIPGVTSTLLITEQVVTFGVEVAVIERPALLAAQLDAGVLPIRHVTIVAVRDQHPIRIE